MGLCVGESQQRDRVVIFPSGRKDVGCQMGRASWGLEWMGSRMGSVWDPGHTSLKYKGRDTASVGDNRVEQVIRGETEGYEG